MAPAEDFMAYGNFQFGRVSAADRNGPAFFINSNNARFQELDGFKRIGSFKFKKLAPEIKDMILNILIVPFLHRQDGTIHVKLEHTYGYQDGYRHLQEQIIAYKSDRAEEAKTALWDRGIKSHLMSLEQCHENDRRQYQEFRALLAKYEDNGYYMEAHAYKNEGGSDKAMTDLLRNLSHVSREFRQMLGHCVWSKARLEVRHAATLGFLPRFFSERPAIHKIMKSMEVGLDLWAMASIEVPDEQTTINNNLAVQFLAKNVEVPVLDFRIGIDERDLGDLAQGTGKFHSFSEFQQMKVTDAFKLVLVVLADEFDTWWELPDHRDDNSQELRYCVDKCREHVPTILNLLTPYTLQDEKFENSVCCGICNKGKGKQCSISGRNILGIYDGAKRPNFPYWEGTIRTTLVWICKTINRHTQRPYWSH